MPIAPARRNGILSHLSPEDLGLLEPHLMEVELTVRQRLATPNRPIEHVYFLSNGIASIVTNVRHEIPVEVGIIGREGLVNLPVVIGTDRSPNDTFMQVAGEGERISADNLRVAMKSSGSLRQTLQHYVHVFMMQTASTVLANGRASIAERLSRWLLMAHDRCDSDTLPLTHEFLSIMLGVRRSSVTVSLRALEQRKIVARRRGSIVILDRDGLVEAANGYYGLAENELQRLFG